MCYSWFQLPKVTLNEQLSSVLSGDIPESILLINTAEWQGQVRRKVYFNSLLGAIPNAKTGETFSVRRMSFPELALISFTFNSAFHSSNVWFSYKFILIAFSDRFSSYFHHPEKSGYNLKTERKVLSSRLSTKQLALTWPSHDHFVSVFFENPHFRLTTLHHLAPSPFWVTKDSVLASTVGGIEEKKRCVFNAHAFGFM